MGPVKKIDKTVQKESLEADLKFLCLIVRPYWGNEDISFEELQGGTLNDIYKCALRNDPDPKKNDALIVRIYSSQAVGSIVNRDKEVFGMQVALAAGVSEPLHIIFNNGLVYGYAPGDLGYWGMLWDDHLARLHMQMLTKFHAVDIAELQLLDTKGELVTVKPKLSTFKNLRIAARDIPEKYVNFPDRKKRVETSLWSKARIHEEIDTLEGFLSKFGFRVVFAHNDAWVFNVIYDKESDKMSLIDFEFAAFSYESWDLALLLCSFQLFEIYNEVLPSSLRISPEELKLPRTVEHNRKLTRMYVEERCLRQGKSRTDFTEEEFEQFHKEAEMMTTVTFFYWTVFLMTQFDDPEMTWDPFTMVEFMHQKYLSQREDLLAIKPF